MKRYSELTSPKDSGRFNAPTLHRLNDPPIVPDAHRAKPDVKIAEPNPEQAEPGKEHVAAIEAADAAIGLVAGR